MYFLDAESTLLPVTPGHNFGSKGDLHLGPCPSVIVLFVIRFLFFLKDAHKLSVLRLGLLLVFYFSLGGVDLFLRLITAEFLSRRRDWFPDGIKDLMITFLFPFGRHGFFAEVYQRKTMTLACEQTEMANPDFPLW